MTRILRSADCNGRVVISGDAERSHVRATAAGHVELEAIEIAPGHELAFESAEPLHVSVDRIEIGDGGTVRVAAPLELTADSFAATGTPSVIVVGSPGPPGPSGSNSSYPGAPGGNGANGGRGADAWEMKLQMGEISGTFIVIARGGDGGAGGNGGQGGPGAIGGNGGNGADGGNGSRVTISFTKLAPNTNIQIDNAPASGGNGGNGGMGGAPSYLMGLPGHRGSSGTASVVTLIPRE